jgi:hypothetical protein
MNDKNAKEEFLMHVKDSNKIVKAAEVQIGYEYDDEDIDVCRLKVGYSDEDYEKFLSSLDFVYDAGFGGQELYGTIWYVGGTWSSRGECDGRECWEYNSCPKIPKELK